MIYEAHILRLPSDVLYQVLLLIWKEEENRFHPERGHVINRISTVASHVCRSWGSTAIDSAILWSSIKFTKPMVRNRLLEETKLWLERSKTTGLEIEMPLTIRNRYIRDLMRLLRPHVGRWKSFKLPKGLPNKVIRTIFDQLRDTSPTMLEAFEFNAESMGRWKFRGFEGGAPNLRAMAIGSRPFDFDLSVFKRLAVLHIRARDIRPREDFDIRQISSLLTSASAGLEEFTFCLPKNQPGLHLLTTNPPFFPIILPELQSMQMFNYSYITARDSAMYLCICIQAPKLHSLSIHSAILSRLLKSDRFNFDQIKRLCSFGHCDTMTFPSLPHLQELTLANIQAFDHRILETSFPQLRSFTVMGLCIRWQSFVGFSETIQARQRNAARMWGSRDLLSTISIKGVNVLEVGLDWFGENVEKLDNYSEDEPFLVPSPTRLHFRTSYQSWLSLR